MTMISTVLNFDLFVYSSKNFDGRLNYAKMFMYYVSEKMFLKLLQSVDNETWCSSCILLLCRFIFKIQTNNKLI